MEDKDYFAVSKQIQADNSQAKRSLLLASILVVVEGLAVYGYVQNFLSLPYLLVIHACMVLMAGGCVMMTKKMGDDLRFSLVFFLSTLTTGPFAGMGFLLFQLFYKVYRRYSTPFSVWFHDLFPEEPSIFDNVYERICAGWDDYSNADEVIPFIDIFSYGSLLEKQAVLDLIIKDYRPEYAPILKEAKQDRSNVLRIQAAAIMAKIDADFDDQLKELKKTTTQEDPLSYLRLARHFDAHAFSGILDPIREKECLQEAISLYQSYLELKPDDRTAWLSVGRLLFRIGDFNHVLTWYQEYQKPDREKDVHAMTWYLEALFLLKQYAALSQSAEEIRREITKRTIVKEMQEAVHLWTEQKNGHPN